MRSCSARITSLASVVTIVRATRGGGRRKKGGQSRTNKHTAWGLSVFLPPF